MHDFKWKRFSGILSTQLFLMLVMLVIVLGCGGVDSDDLKFQKSQTVSGSVLKIEAKSLLELESLTVLDDLGTEWVFEIEHPPPWVYSFTHQGAYVAWQADYRNIPFSGW